MRRKVERSKVLSTLRGAYEASQAIEDDPTNKEIERSLQDLEVYVQWSNSIRVPRQLLATAVRTAV